VAFRLDQFEDDLLACLCELLITEGRPVCACHHYGGARRQPADRCGESDGANGQAWLRRDESVWTPQDGSQMTWGGSFCGAGSAWQTEIEVGIYRCIKAVQQDKVAPDPDLYNQDRELLAADRQTLYQVLCCDAWDDDNYPFGLLSAQVSPQGPMGACAGSILTFSISGDPTVTDEPVPAPEPEMVFVSGPAGGG
jgi:hypothetical protein